MKAEKGWRKRKYLTLETCFFRMFRTCSRTSIQHGRTFNPFISEKDQKEIVDQNKHSDNKNC